MKPLCALLVTTMGVILGGCDHGLRSSQTELAVSWLSAGISSHEFELAGRGTSAAERGFKSFLIERHQRALRILRAAGEIEECEPIVLYGILAPAPAGPKATRAADYSLLVDWLSTRSNVDGIFVLCKSGATLEFPGSVRLAGPSSESERHPYGWASLWFSTDSSGNASAEVIGLSADQAKHFSEGHGVERVGLIFEDGTHSDAADVFFHLE